MEPGPFGVVEPTAAAAKAEVVAAEVFAGAAACQGDVDFVGTVGFVDSHGPGVPFLDLEQLLCMPPSFVVVASCPLDGLTYFCAAA